MLYFMIAHMHGAGSAGTGVWNGWSLWVAVVVVLGLEANALFGKTGPITTVKGVIGGSVALTVVLGLIVGMG